MSGRPSRTGFLVKRTYRTKSDQAQPTVYYQAAPRRGENGEVVSARAMLPLIASNALSDPEFSRGRGRDPECGNFGGWDVKARSQRASVRIGDVGQVQQ